MSEEQFGGDGAAAAATAAVGGSAGEQEGAMVAAAQGAAAAAGSGSGGGSAAGGTEGGSTEAEGAKIDASKNEEDEGTKPTSRTAGGRLVAMVVNMARRPYRGCSLPSPPPRPTSLTLM